MSVWAQYGQDFVPEAQEGWAWPLGLARAHYFHRRLSLCGAVELIDHDGEPDRIDRNPLDRCRKCDTRRAALERYRAGERRTA